jgi:serine/threonine-protein kinase
MMLATSDDLAQGVTFGAYVVHERIGRGGMATVYRAEHRLLEKPVALKVMDRSLLETPAGLQRFLLEGRAAAAIKHPNVVDITDVGVHEGVPYLVMELLTGVDLDTHLRKQRRLDNGDAIRLALPVVSALHAAHGSGVVHRDIKPSNIFLSVGPDDQLVPKVLDFGISKMSFDRATIERMPTPRNQIIGTPQYLPPEALMGPGAMGPLSDQYSLGVVLYQCVTGRTPFAGDTLLALLEALARGSFEPPRAVQPSVSAGLEQVILRALSPEPDDRFPTIRHMGRALVELAAERTQTVWGQSFATPAHGRELTPSTDDLLRGRGVLQSGERLTTQSLRRPRPWRRVAIGATLLLGAALAAIWGPGLIGKDGSSHEAASSALAPERAAPPAVIASTTAALSPPPRAASEPAPLSFGSRPAADSSATASAPSQTSDRAGRVRKALAGKSRAAKSAKLRGSKSKAKAAGAARARAAAAATEAAATGPAATGAAATAAAATRAEPNDRDAPVFPAADPARPLPDPSGPILGANGAPLLD